MAASYAALAPPLQGEDMDISSPGQIDFDDDILLDDGDHHIEQQSLDERMQEGDERLMTNDEEMSDDAQHAEVREEVMGDDAVGGEDEDLIDYSDDEEQEQLQQDEPVDDAPQPVQEPEAIAELESVSHVVNKASIIDGNSQLPEDGASQHIADAEAGEVADEEIRRDPEAEQLHAEIVAQAEQPQETVIVRPDQIEELDQHGEVDATSFTLDPPVSTQQEEHLNVEDTENATDDVNHTEPPAVHLEGSTHLQQQEYSPRDDDNNDQVGPRAGQAGATDELKQPPVPIDNDNLEPALEVPGTPTDTGLHPMILEYGEFEIPLFKSKHQPDGLLKDDNLASVSLAELMQNCRQRLASKLGIVIPEDQELILRFDNLSCNLVEASCHYTDRHVCTRLTVVQNTRPAFETSLNDILDVFLQLHRNDGVDDIPHFQLTLTHQVTFSSSLSAFKTAAAGGQGMSVFGLQYQPQPDYDGDREDYQEQYYEETTRQDDTEADEEYQHEHEEDHYQVGDEYTEEQLGNPEDLQEYTDAAGQEEYEGQYDQDNEEEQDQSALATVQDPSWEQTEKHPTSTNEIHSHYQEEGSVPLAYSNEGDEEPSSDHSNGLGNDDLDHDSHKEYQEDDNDLAADQQEDVTNPLGTDENPSATSPRRLDENTPNGHGEPVVTSEENGEIDFTLKDGVDNSDPFSDPYGNALEDAADLEQKDGSIDAGVSDGQQSVGKESKLRHEPQDTDNGDGAQTAAVTAQVDSADLPTSIALADDEDTIDFDDDTQEEHARKESRAQVNVHPTGASSPNGKRSFDEHAEDDIDLSSPDAKKARSQ
ncbi:hypothetical protein K431DRAFT_328 [Polychaeton citri CBS 116435]|uniref:Uncharacterized protein n=1 Tax=Polychaeton citri CBS 116435 TaxID=1314669 RepID=A0A9P4UTF6_9PEZI|nr:hypothetical protein K431DRAFT_328 [Polychaeton citri CBS 116435]